jgi:3-dehydroquinate synthase
MELDIKIPAVDERGYTIFFGNGFLDSVLEQVAQQFPQNRPFLITDRHLQEAGHMRTLVSGKNVPLYVIDPPGEVSKHVHTVISIIEAMEKAALGRDTVVLALGGGTVGDIAGFAAAVFKRGVPVIQIPTTTLAQADSSVGGKTGVDSSLSKNAFGAFWHPAAVYIDVKTLQSLDERQYRAGLVESVKHGIIADKAYFEYLEAHMDAILQRQPDVLTEIAFKNCRIKGHVVEIDPQEKNMRRILNYGHTIGHAVESASMYELLHGEAVAIGIMGAGFIEMEMNLTTPERLQRVRAILEKLEMPLHIPVPIELKTVLDLIRHDKKAVDKWPRFVLTKELGQICQKDGQWAVNVERPLVEKVLMKLAKG